MGRVEGEEVNLDDEDAIEYFYTTDAPHQWTSGVRLSTLNESYQPIASLEEAKELALLHRKGVWGR